jgi:hypothetical protein
MSSNSLIRGCQSVVVMYIICVSISFAQTQQQSLDAGNTTSATERVTFASSLSRQMQARGMKYATSGDQSETLEASVTAAVDAVTLLGNRFGALLSQHGFTSLHIILPDGNGKADEWIADIGPQGYSNVLSTIFCSHPTPGSSEVKFCTDKDTNNQSVSAPQAPPDKLDKVAKALTDKAAQEGNNHVYTVCGKDGKRDSLCIVDKTAKSDGFVQRIGADAAMARALYVVGFRMLLISDGANGFWGGTITATGFTPTH